MESFTGKGEERHIELIMSSLSRTHLQGGGSGFEKAFCAHSPGSLRTAKDVADKLGVNYTGKWESGVQSQREAGRQRSLQPKETRIPVEVSYIREQPRDFCAQGFLKSHVRLFAVLF